MLYKQSPRRSASLGSYKTGRASLLLPTRKNRTDPMDFFFCNDDIERCVKGTRRKWVLLMPSVPKV